MSLRLKVLAGLPENDALRGASAIMSSNVLWKDSYGWNMPMFIACTGDHEALAALIRNQYGVFSHEHLALAADIADLYNNKAIAETMRSIAGVV